MLEYTPLDNNQIDIILAEFTAEKALSSTLLSGGSENTNYLVSTDKHRYVMTICEYKSVPDTQDLADLLELLARHEFPTSRLVHSLENKSFSLFNDKPVLLKKYIEGEIIEDLPYNILQSLGQQLGRLHKIKAPDYLPDKPNYGTDKFSIVASYAPDSTFYHWLKEMRQTIMDGISPTLPKALIHADVFYNNVIISKDGTRATIMDFEEACNYYRVFDLGMMIIGLCSEGSTINLKKVRDILTGYQQENQLLALEQQSLKLFTAYWRHMWFNHLEPDIKMKDHYLIMKNLTDHVMELDDDCFNPV